MSNARKLHFKHIIDDAGTHVGRPGDVWFNEDETELRTYDNGTPGGKAIGGGGSTFTYKDYGPYSGADVAIDLDYTGHWLVDLGTGYKYTLADGTYDGQTIYFFPANGYGYGDMSPVQINSVKYWNAGVSPARYASTTLTIAMFQETLSSIKGMVTAMWVNGSWNLSTGPSIA